MPRSRPSPRARPLAELSFDALEAGAEELARRWAIALILARAPADIAGVPLEELAREGPALCAQAVRALRSDAELDRLLGRGAVTGREQSAPAHRLGAIAGVTDPAATVEAGEALRGVLWDALLEEHQWTEDERSGSRQLVDLADRLAHVCACAVAGALAAPEAHAPSSPVQAPVAEAFAQDTHAQPPLRPPAVIVDERVPDSPRAAPVGPVEPASPTPSAAVAERPLSWDESPPVPPGPRSGEIEIRDERGEEGPAAWIGAIGRQLERHREDGVPFAVLLIEPVDIDRVRRLQAPDELQRLGAEMEGALAEWSGALTRQRIGRYWLLAPATNRLGARELADRVQARAGATLTHRGAPVPLAIGAAVAPDDGLEAATLAAHADVDLYAARSAARRATGRTPAPIDEPA